MCDCDIDGPKVFHKETRKARKDYECAECRRTIQRREFHEVRAGLWEDNWETYRWCAHCAAAQPICADLADCHCFLYTYVWEDMHNHADGTGDKQLIRLVKGADRKWTCRRGPRKGQLVPVPVAALVPQNGEGNP